MAFPKGQSGNPSGRAAETAMSQEVKRLAKEQSPNAIKRLVEWMQSDNPKASVAACNALLDRAIGKAVQIADVNHSGSIGNYTRVPTERRDIDPLESSAGSATPGNPTQPH